MNKYLIFLTAVLIALTGCNGNEPEMPGMVDPVDPVDPVIPGVNGGDYSIVLKQTGFPAEQIPSRHEADFDGDGIVDPITNDPTNARGNEISIQLSKTQTQFTYVVNSLANERKRILSFKVFSLSPTGEYPSIIVAQGNWSRNFIHSLPQMIVFNDHGTLRAQELGISLIGRAVDCAWINQKPMCYFASYGENDLSQGLSSLVEITPQGVAIDRTQAFGLPFQVPFSGHGTDGYHMIGSALLDFNGDGNTDIVSVGQHSRIFTGELGADGHVIRSGYHGPSGEYRKVWAPLEGQVPCVYYGMELEESSQADYVECYRGGSWQKIDLPGGEYGVTYVPVNFWDHGDDGAIDFAARRTDGTWNLLTILPPR